MKLRLTALSLMAFVCIATSQSPDSTKKTASPPLKLAVAEGVRFPSQSERLTVLGAAVVLVGGLGLILNEKRRRADKRLVSESEESK
jgi:hypothetical protein